MSLSSLSQKQQIPPPGYKLFSKGEKIKKLIGDLLTQNSEFVERDIRWRDFGSKFKGRLKRDGSVVTEVMREEAGKTTPSDMVEISSPSEMRRIVRKIEDLIKWSQEAKKQSRLDDTDSPQRDYKNPTPLNAYGVQQLCEISDYVSSMSEASSSSISKESERR